ncbi:MAG: hypothetical protein IID33_00590 [Planctomycetes bacterium]|nr:hypothetical protein [Planctomycetota bacterium]
MKRLKTSRLAVCFCLLMAPALAGRADGQDDPTAERGTVSREEFKELLEEIRRYRAEQAGLLSDNEELRRSLDGVRTEFAELKRNTGEAKLDLALDEMRASIMAQMSDAIDRQTEWLKPGLTNFVIGGAAVTAFQNRDGADSTFGVGVAPTLLWSPMDRLLFETEIAFALTSDDTSVELDYAQFSYLLNDYLTIGAGKFLLPFGKFWEGWHPSWINRLPTIPLMYERGLMGATGLGVQLRGGAAIGPTKINYAAYVINGPDFQTSFASAGKLGFNNHRDNNNNKAVGGRFGFLPIPELEIGYSVMSGRVGDSGSQYGKTDMIAHGIDLSYNREIDAIRGRLDLRAEVIWVDTDAVVFTGPFNPFTFRNRRHGWFVQAAYRPTKVDLKLPGGLELKNFEFAARYDQVRQFGPRPLGEDHDQLTLGIDYWILPNVVVKVAYMFDDAHGAGDQNGFFVQFAVGF